MDMSIRIQASQVYLLALTIISIIGYFILFRNQENLAACRHSTTIIIENLLNSNNTFFNNQTIIPTTINNTQTCTNIPSNILQLQNFQFYKSSKVCLNQSPSIIIVVHSAIHNLMRRDAIRSTWGSIKKYRGWTIDLVFLLGIEGNSSTKITQPPPDYNEADVVIGNFIDSYANLTYKHLMGYKWVLQHCPTAQYIIKTDDDIFLDTFHLIKIIEDVYEHNNTTTSSQVSIIGNMMRDLLPESGEGKPYPDFVSGLGYVIKIQAACALLKIQNSKSFFEIDDVFVTGILRQELNLIIHGINSEYFIDGFPGLSADQLLSWYNKSDDKSVHLTPSPWTFILLGPKFPELSMVNLWELWYKTMRGYGFSPGYGFND